MNDTTERVRYGRVNSLSKNTLLTISNGDLIHFGIARCNSKLDHFRKDTGKLIARNRAELAAEETIELAKTGKILEQYHPSGLRGSVSVDRVKRLLKYFENIDTSMLNQLRAEHD